MDATHFVDSNLEQGLVNYKQKAGEIVFRTFQEVTFEPAKV
jgi:hypothetical protein